MKTNRLIELSSLLLICVLICVFLFSCGKTGDVNTASDTAASAAADPASETGADSLKAEDILDGNGMVTGKNYYNADGYLISREIYDEAGRTVEYTTFNPSGDPSTSTKYNYLSGDKANTYVFEIYEYEKGALKQLVTRLYNGDDLLLSVLVTDGNGERVESFTYEYDDSGRMIKESRANEKNVLSNVTEYEYGEDGYVSRTTYKTGSGKVGSYTEYERDANGKVLKDNNYDAEGNMTSYVEYVYDESGNVAETHEYLPDENGEFICFD